MRYNMGMDTVRHDISGVARPPVTVEGLIRGMLVKRAAPPIVSASRKKARTVPPAGPAPQPRGQWTYGGRYGAQGPVMSYNPTARGNAEAQAPIPGAHVIPNVPPVKNPDAATQAFYARQAGNPQSRQIRRDAQDASAQAAIDAQDPYMPVRRGVAGTVKMFDEAERSGKPLVTPWSKTIGGNLAAGVITSPALVLQGLDGLYRSALSAANGGSFSKTWNDYALGLGRQVQDDANTLQLVGRGAVHGASSLGRLALRYIDPTTWGWSDYAKKRRRMHDIARENSEYEFLEGNNRIVSDYRSSDLRHPESSTLGAVNYGLATAMGEFAGTGGAFGAAGSAARGAASALARGGSKVVGAIRGTAPAATAPFAAKAVSMGRNALGGAVDWVGGTLTAPIRGARNLLSPSAYGRGGAMRNIA